MAFSLKSNHEFIDHIEIWENDKVKIKISTNKIIFLLSM
jgi:hypothetical protein